MVSSRHPSQGRVIGFCRRATAQATLDAPNISQREPGHEGSDDPYAGVNCRAVRLDALDRQGGVEVSADRRKQHGHSGPDERHLGAGCVPPQVPRYCLPERGVDRVEFGVLLVLRRARRSEERRKDEGPRRQPEQQAEQLRRRAAEAEKSSVCRRFDGGDALKVEYQVVGQEKPACQEQHDAVDERRLDRGEHLDPPVDDDVPVGDARSG